jgi:ABC-2 type transport system ATP-binding protein
MDLLLEANNITKRYGDKLIYNNANMVINRGDSIALMGHNGCGKSTFLKIICGLTTIDSGEIKSISKIKYNYIPEHFPQMNITARKYITLIGEIDGLRKTECVHRSEELFKQFFIHDMVDVPLKHLSKGTLQKVGVIQALMVKSDILLLDEPLSGQDMDSQKVFISLIKELNEQGTTVVMSCHEKFLVNRLSNSVYEIDCGKFKKIEMEHFSNKSDMLIFEREDNVIISEDIISMVERIEYDERDIKILVTSDKSNNIIKKLLSMGFRLRRMTDEAD